MMAALQKNEGYKKKGPKKTFAPPAQRLHSMMSNSFNSHKEDTLGVSPPEAEASLKRTEQKTDTENGLSMGHEEKQKVQDKKPSENRKGKATISNAEFEEVVQTVLQKSLQDCLETSYVQRIVCIQSGREPGMAASANENITAGERAMAPNNPEIPVPLEDNIDFDIQTSELGQVAPRPAKKKFSRPNLSKRKKIAHENMEEIHDGHDEFRQKNQQMTVTQDHSQIRDQQEKGESGFGQCLVWVQCSYPMCEKWRRLHGSIDPSVLPDNWSCDQNPDLDYNRCDIPEETWIGCESEVAYASYVPGSIIWAKQYGYPWWPGMVESDPDLGEYFLFSSHLDYLPSKYHVTFFGETACRAWIPVNMLKKFQDLPKELDRVKKFKSKDYSQKLEVAIVMAQMAEQTNIQERVSLFGFWSRYNSSEKEEGGKDSMLSEPNSPASCLEKEDEDLEPEKQEKGDPTLPGPKPAKVQTKRTKPRDPKRNVKAPESTASEEKEDRTVPLDLSLSAHHGFCPFVEKEGPSFREEPPTSGGLSFPPEDEASGYLDLDQLMEDIGREEVERRQDPQYREDSEVFLEALFE